MRSLQLGVRMWYQNNLKLNQKSYFYELFLETKHKAALFALVIEQIAII